MSDARDIRTFLVAAGYNLHNVLTNCTDAELYELNAEAYGIYCAIFGEIKMRVAQKTLMYDHIDFHTNKWGYSDKMKETVY